MSMLVLRKGILGYNEFGLNDKDKFEMFKRKKANSVYMECIHLQPQQKPHFMKVEIVLKLINLVIMCRGLFFTQSFGGGSVSNCLQFVSG